MLRTLWHKIRESIFAVLPVTAIVLLISFTLIDIDSETLLLFVISVFLFIVGMSLFTLGVDIAMIPMGEGIGAGLVESKKQWLTIPIVFLMGFIITIAEPDLQLLANQVRTIPSHILILAVSCGVGVFLVLFLMKIYFKIKLGHMLAVLYGIVFILAIFVPKEFLSVAFDSGGVTTGPVSVPFILALGIGITSVRESRNENNSFGMIALCSVGPIFAIMILGLLYNPQNSVAPTVEAVTHSNIALHILKEFIKFLGEVGLAIFPIIVCFILFQIFVLKYPKARIIRMIVGILYTYMGLIFFLLAVNIGFMPVGQIIGTGLAAKTYNYILIPLGFILGSVIVLAEPAIHILTNQVEDLTGGAISKKLLLISLTIGIAFSVTLSMVRVLYGISLWYFILPGYIIAIALTFVVPSIFTSIAFDAGGVASGPMTVAFVLPLAMGASKAIGGNVYTDAFGIVAMVAMAPLITLQIFGLVYKIKLSVKSKETAKKEKITATKAPETIYTNEPIEWNEE